MDQAVQESSQTHRIAKYAMPALLLVLSVAVRVPGIERPLVGNFSTKNVVYGMIARNWAEGRAGILYPTLDCVAGGQRSLHMLEFPVSAYLTAVAWKTLGGSLDIWGRATSVAFTTASVLLLFLFVRRRHGPEAALGAGFCFALSPVGVIYGQSFMLEASLVFFTVATFYTLDRWLAGGRAGWLVLAAACLALLLLTKIYMLVILLPLVVAVLCAGLSGRRKSAAILLLGLAVVPAALWYWHAYRTADPSGPHAGQIFYSVRDSVSVHRPPHPILRSPDFYRQMLDDASGVVLTPIGLMLLLAGFLDRDWRRYAAWLSAICVLVLLLPLKFYEMNYYQMVVLPPLCVVVGLGWRVVQERIRPGRAAVAVLLLVGLVFSARYAGRAAFVTPHEDRAVVAAGRAVQRLAGAEEPVVTMHGTAIDLVYYCNRPGWALAPDSPRLEAAIEDCRRQGARYLVVAGPAAESPPPAVAGLPRVAEGEGYVIHAIEGEFRGNVE